MTPIHFKVLLNALQQILADHRHVSLTLTFLGKSQNMLILKWTLLILSFHSFYQEPMMKLTQSNAIVHISNIFSIPFLLLSVKSAIDVFGNLLMSLVNLLLPVERLPLSFTHVELFKNF